MPSSWTYWRIQWEKTGKLQLQVLIRLRLETMNMNISHIQRKQTKYPRLNTCFAMEL